MLQGQTSLFKYKVDFVAYSAEESATFNDVQTLTERRKFCNSNFFHRSKQEITTQPTSNASCELRKYVS